MGYNAEAHFQNLPQLSKSTIRTIFRQPYTHLTTFNAGKLVPIYVQKYMPGDTFKMNLRLLMRMSTPIAPTMDNLYLDTFWFSVPKRLVWDHAKEFYGENTTSEWEPEIEYEIPQIKAPEGGWRSGSVADHMGIRPGIENIEVDALKFRAMCLIWNEWFRDQNLQKPIIIDKGDTTVTGSNGTDIMVDSILGGELLPVNKLHDRFTSALPEPGKGPEVLLPIGLSCPVYPGDGDNDFNLVSGNPIKMANNNGAAIEGSALLGTSYNNGQAILAAAQSPAAGTMYQGGVTFTNLQADLSQATGANILQLYQAMAIQQQYIIDARGGTRYREIIKANYGVTTSNAAIQVPEMLYARRIPVNMNQVVQTSGTTETSPQGNTAAFSLTIDNEVNFTKSFEEWGYLMGFVCVRHENTYQQGIDAEWFEKRRFDEYWPALANLGDQPIYNRELYATGTDADKEVFGYGEAWSNYRYKTNRISGEFRSSAVNSLDYYHYADNYKSQPILGPEWIQADKNSVDRTLAVTSEVSNQFHADFYFNQEVVRPMPAYSMPGIPRNL